MAVSVKLDETLRARLKAVASYRQRSPHSMMCEAIRQYVEREEARESVRQEALDAWQAYEETSRHLTGPDIQAWLRQWGGGAEADAPPCHT